MISHSVAVIPAVPNSSISVETRGHPLTITHFYVCACFETLGVCVNAAIPLWQEFYLTDTCCLHSHYGHITVLLCTIIASCVYFFKLLIYWHFYLDCFICPLDKNVRSPHRHNAFQKYIIKIFLCLTTQITCCMCLLECSLLLHEIAAKGKTLLGCHKDLWCPCGNAVITGCQKH